MNRGNENPRLQEGDGASAATISSGNSSKEGDSSSKGPGSGGLSRVSRLDLQKVSAEDDGQNDRRLNHSDSGSSSSSSRSSPEGDAGPTPIGSLDGGQDAQVAAKIIAAGIKKSQEEERHKKSSGGTGVEVGMEDSENTLNTVRDEIVEVCENAKKSHYDNLLTKLFQKLRIQQSNQRCSIIRQIAEEEKNIPNCDTLLHVASEYGAWEIVVLLLNNGYEWFIDLTNDELKDKDKSFLPQTPLTFTVRCFNEQMLFDLLLERSKKPQDAICAAIYYYELVSHTIKPLARLLNNKQYYERAKTLYINAVTPSELYVLYRCANEFQVVLDNYPVHSERLLELLDALPKDKLQSYDDQELNAHFGDIAELHTYYVDNYNCHNDITLELLVTRYFEHSQYKLLLDGLDEDLKQKLSADLHKANDALRYKAFLDLLIDRLDTECFKAAGWPFNLTPLQMASFYCDADYFNKIFNKLPDKQGAEYIQQLDDKGNNLLHLAIKDANLEDANEKAFIEFLLQGYPKLWNKVNQADQSPLSIACLERNLPLIKLMAAQKHESTTSVWQYDGVSIPVDLVKEYVKKKTVGGDKSSGSLQEVKKNATLKVRLHLNGHRSPNTDERNSKSYITPLEDAARLGNVDVVAELISLWPEEVCGLLTRPLGNPFKIAVELERASILNCIPEEVAKNPYYPLAEKNWEQVQHLFLEFLHSSADQLRKKTRESFVDLMIKGADSEIQRVDNPQLKKSMMQMLRQLEVDYNNILTEVRTQKNNQFNAVDFEKINKIFYLMHELSVQASSAKIKDKTKEQVLKDKESFETSCSTKLYSEIISARWSVILFAMIGLVLGAVFGLVVGTLITAGGPGGLWLTLPSAQYGSAVGASIGCAIGAIAGGGGYYGFSETFKWQRGLWSVSSKMSSVDTTKPDHSEEVVPLLEAK